MVIGSRPDLKKISTKLVEPPSFSTDGSEVEMVDNVNYLGVQIDKLAWDEHIHFVRSKVSRAIGFLKYAKKLLPQDALCKMYRGIVEPQLRYCCSIWGGACGGTKLQALQKLQNRAARILSNSSYDSSASALIKILNWPTVSDMIKVETACMV